MRRVYRSLSFIFLPAVISVSAHAVSLRDLTSVLGAGSSKPDYDNTCDDYPIDSRKGSICRSYSKDKVHKVATLPASKDLKADSLYILSGDGGIEAPYSLKNGVGIIPTPDKDQVILTPSGTGTDNDCGLCVMKFAEGTKVAGLSVNISGSNWKPKPGKGEERAIFYGSTSTSEFSESTVWGRSDFVDVIHQYMTVSGDNMQSYHRLNLYAGGSQNLLRVENANSSSAVSIPEGDKWHVDIANSTGTLSGNISSSATEQGGFVLNNLVGSIYSSSIFYEPLAASKTFSRFGFIATDTPALYIYRDSHKVTREGYSRKKDKEELYRNEHQSKMMIFSDDNSYFPEGEHYINELTDQSGLVYYLGNNEEYASTDVDNSAESISKLTKYGGFYLGNTQELKAICPVNPDLYNVSNPYPVVNGVQIQEGPANSTTKDLYSFCVANVQNTACNRSVTDRLIDGAIGGGIVLIASSPFIIGSLICLCRSVAKRGSNKDGYTAIPSTSNTDD